MTNHPQVELTLPGDPYFDYCLWQYKPVASEEGKLRSVNLLYHTFLVGEMPDSSCKLVAELRKGIGPFSTVWGVKKVGSELRWEFYFYDYRRRERERSVTRVLETIRPLVPCAVTVNERLNYFMFSLDFDRSILGGAKALEEVHMYIGNPGSTVSSGICYSVTPGRTRLENFYFFFDARQRQDIAGKIASSVFFDSTAHSIDRLLWPEMGGCRVIVVANKQQNDALYFSRITVGQLLFFLERMSYPVPHVDFVRTNRDRLDHLLYDVGFDYRFENGELRVLKSGYYGVF